MKKAVSTIGGKASTHSEQLKDEGWLTYEELRLLVRRETGVSPTTLASWFRTPLQRFVTNLVEHQMICQPDNWTMHRLYHPDLVAFFSAYIRQRKKLLGKGTSVVRRTEQFIELFNQKENFEGDQQARVIQLRRRKSA